MTILEVKNLTKTFGSLKAVDDVSFSMEAGEILAIIGESGCGKTTTLRCIAGLETPTVGEISVEGVVMYSSDVFVPAEKRGLGMVFQSYALWPHMSVFDNIAYGLVLKGIPKAAIRERVDRIIDLVGLGGMADRFPSTLSGGQQQRVALARAAVVEPRILLLDEPLSNLDAKLREQMRGDLKHMIKQLQMTAVHITHDQHEAMGIADRIICMRKGRIEQEGTSRELYRFPASRFIADFIGMATFLDGTLVEREASGKTRIRIAEDVELWSANSPADPQDKDVVISIRPENFTLSVPPIERENTLSGRIAAATFYGSYMEYYIDVGGLRLRAHSQQEFEPDSSIHISVDPERVICLPREKHGS